MTRAQTIGMLLFAVVGNFATAQAVEYVTFQNSVLQVRASDLTTNGVPGLTNTAPHLMVSWVSPNSAHQGTVSLVATQVWARRYDGPGQWTDNPLKVVVDEMQNVIVTGYSLGSNSGYDFVTIKYFPDGTPFWTNRFDGPSHRNDFARGLAVDASGNIYVTGDSEVSSATLDVAIVKYSPSGSLLWASRFNQYGTNYHQPSCLAVDALGNAFVTVNNFFTSERPFITVKFDSQGNAAWTNYYKGSPNGSDFAGTVAVDPFGNIIVNGGSDGIGTGENYVTLKYTQDGSAIWTNRYVGGILENPTGMTLDRQGNVIVTGDSLLPSHHYATVKYSNSGIPLWTNLLPAPSYQGGSVPIVVADIVGNVFVTGGSPSGDGSSADFTTVKLSAAGAPLWTNRFFEINLNNSAPGGTAVDSVGNFYFAGHSTGPGGTNIDFVTVKYDLSGTAIWNNRYNGLTANSSDSPQDIIVDQSGNVYVTGLSGGSTGDFATVKYADFVRYTPPTNFVGADSFTFIAFDNFGNCATGVVMVAVMPTNLQFNTSATNLVLAPEGMRLQVDGARGTNTVIIYASTNLVDWKAISTNQPVLGSVNLTDYTATNVSRRFYRAVQLQ